MILSLCRVKYRFIYILCVIQLFKFSKEIQIFLLLKCHYVVLVLTKIIWRNTKYYCKNSNRFSNLFLFVITTFFNVSYLKLFLLFKILEILEWKLYVYIEKRGNVSNVSVLGTRWHTRYSIFGTYGLFCYSSKFNKLANKLFLLTLAKFVRDSIFNIERIFIYCLLNSVQQFYLINYSP